MNNEKFFPNFNNQPADTSLNQDNTPIVNQTPVNDQPAPPVLDVNINPNVIQFPEIGMNNLTAQPIETPNTTEVSNIPVELPNIESTPTPILNPSMEETASVPATPVMEAQEAAPSDTPPIIDIPLFANQQTEQTVQENNNSPIEEPSGSGSTEVTAPPLPIIDTPIFNGTALPQEPTPVVTEPINVEQAPVVPIENALPSVEPMVEQTPVPVESNEQNVPVVEVTDNNQEFENIKQLLNENNIPYNAYSNENKHCIIIEI